MRGQQTACDGGQVTDDLTLDASRNQGKGGWGGREQNKPRATGETGPFDSKSPGLNKE